MPSKIIPVTETNKSRLYSYSASYAGEHDTSYIPGRDFELSDEYPSYLLENDEEIIGAVCLMRTRRFLSIDKARFSIFHIKDGDSLDYERLLGEILPHTVDLNSIYLFVPEYKEKTGKILAELGFQIERYSFILERDDPVFSAPVFPDGISVHHLDPSDHEGIANFAACINEEFKHLAGHSPSTADDIQTWFNDEEYIPGGLCLLLDGGNPIGTIALMKDLDTMNSGEIGAFGILGEYRGRGLGRMLLRYGYNYLVNKKLTPVVLSVNGENHGAIKLYETEGFRLSSSVICYSLACS